MDLFRPSLEEAFVIQKQEVALDFIGKRGSAKDIIAEERIAYARDLLRSEVLPHVGVGERCETRKVFFLGYAVHKLLMCRLGRSDEDDRDHFGKKRLDLAGPLLGGLFRTLLRKLEKDGEHWWGRGTAKLKYRPLRRMNHLLRSKSYRDCQGNCTRSRHADGDK